MKRLTSLILLAMLIGCVPADVDVEYIDGYTVIGVKDEITVDGLMNLPNDLHDTLIYATMVATAEGSFNLGGVTYLELLRVYDLGSGSDTVWTQLNMSTTSGGGDTAASVVKQSNHTAPVGCAYDSCLRQRALGSVVSGDSNPYYYASQDETTALASGDGVQYDWTWTASKLGTAILDSLLYHIVDFWQDGVCDDIDTMVFCYANGDTTRHYAVHSYDHSNDTLFFTCVDTTRSLANDTIKYGIMLDDDGMVIYHKTLNTAVANPSAVRWIVKIYFVEI